MPVTMNPDNAIVKEAQVADKVYLFTSSGPALFPDETQTVEKIGWWPDGSLAIGIVKFGKGNVFLIGPHPELTIDDPSDLQKAIDIMSGPEAERMGVPPTIREESVAILLKEGDPDGRIPDQKLINALLKEAAARSISAN